MFDQFCFALLQPTAVLIIWFNWNCSDQALSKITSTGAMTFCFIQAIERGQGTTYGSILNSMRTTIRSTGESAGAGGGAVTSLITMLLTGGSLSTGGLRQVNSWAWYGSFWFIQIWTRSHIGTCLLCAMQEPQLTACEPFDVYAKPFSLWRFLVFPKKLLYRCSRFTLSCTFSLLKWSIHPIK